MAEDEQDAQGLEVPADPTYIAEAIDQLAMVHTCGPWRGGQ
jgi:hypothetical protein